MKIGIYGGTYNPPHLGHLAAARTAIDALKLDKLLLMPAAVPPHKALPENTPSQEHRLAMVEKLADAMDLPGVVEVSTLELEREGKSYTSETLEELRRRYPKAELWLLMGTDMFLTLHLWHDAKTILRLAKICAFGRTEQDGEAVFAPQREFLTREYHADVVTITLPGLIDVSSTQLRELLVRGKGREYLLPSVYGYILMNRLYGTDVVLKQLDLPEKRPFKEYSKGMKMKLGIAVALSHHPKLLILDEATSGLDPVVRDEVVEMFSEFTRDEDHAVLISSHIVSDLEKICDYIAFLHQGKLMLCEEKDRLLEEYGLIHCSREQLSELDQAAVKGVKTSPYGVEALVRRDGVPADLPVSPVSIEELFIFMVKEAA